MDYMLAAAAFLGVAMTTAGLIGLVQASREDLLARLTRYDGHETRRAEVAAAGFGRQRVAAMSGAVARGVEKAVANRGFVQHLSRSLSRANLRLTVSEFLAMSALVAVATALLAALVSHSLPVGLLFGLGSLWLPWWYVKGREAKRLAEFNAQLGTTVGIMANSLRSGNSLLQAMDFVARETPPPLGEEFGRVILEIRLGLSLDQALENLVRRVNSSDLDLVVTAIKVQHEVGGNLAAILDTIGETIGERVRLKGQIMVLTAQQTLSGYIIAALPLLLAGVLLLLDPSYLIGLFTPGWYVAMPICAGLGIISGFIAMRKIVAIEV